MFSIRRGVLSVAPLLIATAASAATWCVNPTGTGGCKTTIGAAVAAAAPGDTVVVAAGTYKESITINQSVLLTGADAATTIIDATGQGNGIYVDGIDNQNLSGVYISGFTVQNANFEGILVTNASGVAISGNIIQNNDKGVNFASGMCPNIPSFETNEGEDCGEGVHLSGADHSVVANNTIQNNSGGVLLSDDTGATHDNLISGNTVSNNVLDCGITLASHVPAALTKSTTPLGVYANVVDNNIASGNGVKGDGAGIGIFASAPGTAAYNNVVTNNTATGNGIPGVTIHGHAPNQNLNGNLILANTLSGNGADTIPTATPGPAAINIWAVSPIKGIVIGQNTISGEAYGVVVNAPGDFRVERNSFTRGSVGVLNAGTGSVSADGNYWGCSNDPRYEVPGFSICASISGAVNLTTWSVAPISK